MNKEQIAKFHADAQHDLLAGAKAKNINLQDIIALCQAAERTTSPVSQMTDDLARAAKALLEEQETACLTDAMKALEEMELCHEQVEVSAKLLRKLFLALAAAAPAPASQDAKPDIKEMVNRFLGWKLPANFYPDCGITFDATGREPGGYAWPTGTNVFTADQAKEMFEFCLAAPAAPVAEPSPIPLFDRKLADLQQRGYEVIGRILRKDGEYALFDSSCRWLTKPQYQRLMHEQDGSLFATPAAPAPYPTMECEIGISIINSTNEQKGK